jgi:hypothetical protein
MLLAVAASVANPVLPCKVFLSKKFYRSSRIYLSNYWTDVMCNLVDPWIVVTEGRREASLILVRTGILH